MGVSFSSELRLGSTEGHDSHKFWQEVPLFKCLPMEAHPQLTSCSEIAYFKRGEVVIRQGDEGKDFFVIKSGTALIEVDGTQCAMLSTGDYFGETALLSNEPRSASVTALTPIEAMRISRDNFRKLGLHEKLEFPRRDRMGARYKLMVANATGTSPPRGLPRASLQEFACEGALKLDRSWMEVQKIALLEIVWDNRINLAAFGLVPLGVLVVVLDMPPSVIFFANFVAILPLASLLGSITEMLAEQMGLLVGSVLNATFGNAVEMIMCVQGVKAGLLTVVQGNLLGAVLSNLLLVLGMAIVAASMGRKTTTFNAQGAMANMICQLVASVGICLPTVYVEAQRLSSKDAPDLPDLDGQVLWVSRLCSVFLIFIYGLFLLFMLRTHSDLFQDGEQELGTGEGLNIWLSTVLLATTTLAVAFCSDKVIDCLEDVSENARISKNFIGVILLPIVGNAAEHLTAVGCAHRGHMDLALGVAVGSSTQIGLLVAPFSVIVGWVYDQPMNLQFTVFHTTCQILAVFLVSRVLGPGEVNWLHGLMLITVYVFIAVQMVFLPMEDHFVS